MQLVIEDNGKGFDEKYLAESNSFGIMGMKERASNVGASFEIKSQKNSGTEIIVRFPI